MSETIVPCLWLVFIDEGLLLVIDGESVRFGKWSLGHIRSADVFVLGEFAEVKIIFSLFPDPFGVAVTEVGICPIGAVVVPFIRIIVVNVGGIEFVVAIQRYPGAAWADHDLFQVEPLVGIMFSRSDAGFGSAGLVRTETGGAAGGLVPVTCLKRPFIAPPGKILVAVAVGVALVEGEAQQIKDLPVRHGIGPDVIAGAGTDKEIDGFGVVLVHPVQVVIVITGGGAGQIAVVILGVHKVAQAHLFEIAKAVDAFGPFFGASQGGQKHGGENRDDGDDHQEFDQSKRAASWGGSNTGTAGGFLHQHVMTQSG